MTPHLDDVELRSFIDGLHGEDDAVRLALHLDACPRCSARAARMDSLGGALSELPDPSPPASLVSAVVAEAQRSEPLARVELIVGVSLLLSAALLLGVAGEPLQVVVRLGVLARGLWIAAGHLTGDVSWIVASIALSTLLGGGLVVLMRRVVPVGRPA